MWYVARGTCADTMQGYYEDVIIFIVYLHHAVNVCGALQSNSSLLVFIFISHPVRWIRL